MKGENGRKSPNGTEFTNIIDEIFEPVFEGEKTPEAERGKGHEQGEDYTTGKEGELKVTAEMKKEAGKDETKGGPKNEVDSQGVDNPGFEDDETASPQKK